MAITSAGLSQGTLAGVITTAGAWGVVFGNRYVKGGPTIVMPLVFAGAPVGNSFYLRHVGDRCQRSRYRSPLLARSADHHCRWLSGAGQQAGSARCIIDFARSTQEDKP